MRRRGTATARCADLLKLTHDKSPKRGEPLPFDAVRAHALYKSLLGEADDMIKGKHLIVVPSGALTTLPFQVLVTEPPKSNDIATTHWLTRDHAITVLPSASSLAALRTTDKPSAAPPADDRIRQPAARRQSGPSPIWSLLQAAGQNRLRPDRLREFGQDGRG